jgi:hypothetical protein
MGNTTSNVVALATNTACNSDRDIIALHTGRILQSCSLIENLLFRMAAARGDVEGFTSIERTKGPALRNVISKIVAVLDTEISAKTSSFKNPKSLKDKLLEFDKAAARRSDLAHSEFIGTCEIGGCKVAILANEGIEGSQWEGRRVQLWKFSELADVDKVTHNLANSLRQVIQNQIEIRK